MMNTITKERSVLHQPDSTYIRSDSAVAFSKAEWRSGSVLGP